MKNRIENRIKEVEHELDERSRKLHFPTIMKQQDIQFEIENFYEDNKSIISEINELEKEGTDYYLFNKFMEQ